MGNLRENLGRRRVLGSDFAQDAQGRVAAEFANEEANLRAQNFLAEFEMTQKLIDESYQLNRSSFQVMLDQIQAESEMALQMTTSVAASLGAHKTAQMQLAAQAQAAGRRHRAGGHPAPLLRLHRSTARGGRGAAGPTLRAQSGGEPALSADRARVAGHSPRIQRGLWPASGPRQRAILTRHLEKRCAVRLGPAG